MDLLTYYSDLAVAYPEYITQKQFCEVCGICHKTAYNLTRRGEISYEIVDTPTGRIHHIMVSAWDKLDRGEEYYLWDCDYCSLQSDINNAEVNRIISPEQAWYLREKYLRMEREVVE